MEIKIIVLFIYLLLCSAFDLKNRAVPVWLCYGGILALAAASLWIRDMTLVDIIGGMIPGIVLIGIGQLTKGQVGVGDGMVFMATGIGLGIWNNCLLLTGALFLSFLWSLVFLAMKKMNLKTKFPFLPFVFLSFILEFVIKM